MADEKSLLRAELDALQRSLLPDIGDAHPAASDVWVQTATAKICGAGSAAREHEAASAEEVAKEALPEWAVAACEDDRARAGVFRRPT